MNSLGVPCPSCGSVQVVVGDRADAPASATVGMVGVDGKVHVPQLHDCTCRGCRHQFRHDFAFSA